MIMRTSALVEDDRAMMLHVRSNGEVTVLGT
jgi:hypothetical protein